MLKAQKEKVTDQDEIIYRLKENEKQNSDITEQTVLTLFKDQL